ncbi:NACHT domain- and WD repeat-containing protein 1 [Nematolebias whitei]|uniref:NACHT domain- and WD repeat-containing protein 1 n=1 Tax=Nematolebias whitei TaxID=451745 RepID=UPI001899A7BD|nr:NACHT domain- and WD repeat-containing protein 1 [Nematolebias whitei]
MAAAGDVELQDILMRRCDEAQRTKSNMIRVFISSTFTDMSSERKVLLDKAYPEVLSFCRSLGLVFEVVDLRWGFRNTSFGDHEDWEISLQEIRTCQRVSAGPAFVGLLGNRYGSRVLPRLVPEKQFEVLLSKLSKNPEGIKQLQRWYLKDNNAVPPTYVLQPITAHFPHFCDLRPEDKQLHDNSVLSWRFTEMQLLQLLRSAAADSKADGDNTSEDTRLFYTSVTEKEFEDGLWKDDTKVLSLVFVREIPRQKIRDGPKRFAKFMDVTFDGLLDAEALDLLNKLKSRVYDTCQKILNLHCVELNKGSIEPKHKEHAQYLDSICQQFVSQMKDRIKAVVGPLEERRTIRGRIEDEDDRMVEEARQHAAMSADQSKGVLGREGLLGKICLTMWESTTVRHGPVVVHGDAGMGKTALLCKLIQEMQCLLESRVVLVIRLLAACHPRRFNVDHILRSICLQVCLACSLAPPPPLMDHLELLRFFKNMLEDVSQQGNTLLIVLDSLDQLSDQHHAHKLRWLTADVPPNVHLLVSMDTSSEAFANMRLKLGTLQGFFEVECLSHEEGELIVESYLRECQRTLTAEQKDVVLRSFGSTGCPLHLKLILSAAKRWTSFVPPTVLLLGASTQEVMSQTLLRLEEKHGKELVGGALGYIALARGGLLEVELRDVMSLDDDVISEVYRHTLPPTPSLIRLPPLLWARLRWDLQDQLEERWTDGVIVLTFSSRRVSEAVSARYLTSERRGRSHRILAEYFSGRWSGKLKPASLPGLTLLLSDRKAPPQPLWFAPGLANIRKLQELTYHLLHAGLWEELKQEVIGNAEWLYCQTRVLGVSSVISDLDWCFQYMNCSETRLIRDALVLMKPSLDFLHSHMDKSLFYSELLARLSSLSASCPAVIGPLCSQCNNWLQTCPEPVLIPKNSFLQQPGGALQHILSAPHGGLVCVDVSTVVQLLVSGSDDGVVMVWSLMDHQLVHTLLGHTASLLSVKINENSAHCLSLAVDGSLRRWSLTSGQQLLCIYEAVPVDSVPRAVHLVESDQLLFVYTWTQVKVWSLDGTEIHLSSRKESSVILGVLEDSVVSLCDSSRVRIYHPVNRNQSMEVQLEEPARILNPVSAVTLPKRGKVLVVSEEGFIHQISMMGEQTAAEFPLHPSLFTVTEDETILLAGSERTLSLFNINTDSVDGFLDLQHEDIVLSACVSADNKHLVSGAADQLVRTWSLTTGALLDSLCGSNAPVTLVFFYHHFVISASTAAASIHMWNRKYDTCHKPTAHIPAGSTHVAITKDGDQVFYVRHQSQREVVSWNSLTGSPSEHLPVSAEVSCLELAKHKSLLICGLTSGTVLIYPLTLPQETLCIPPPESRSRVLCLAVSSQEKHLAVAYEDSVCLFEVTTRDSFPTVEGPLGRTTLSLLHAPLSSMALLPERRLLYGTSCGAVKLHDFGSGGGSDLQPHRSRITCVTASNWGAHALVGSEDAVQRLWALDPLVLDHTMEYKGLFFEGVLCAAFSDSDQFVFTGSQDRTIKVWDTTSGKLLCVQFIYSPVVRMVTFRNGFVALSQLGSIIRETFRCPDQIRPDYNPLRSVKAQYRVTSREKNRDGQQTCVSDLRDFNPAQFNLNVMSMLRTKPSPTCVLL